MLNLVDSNVTGTGPNAHGLRLLGAEANVTGSTITGQNAGVRMSREGAARPDAPVLRLNNSVVRGVNGPAIQVASNATAIIEVLNGSTLTAGNGVILDTAIGTTTDLTVASSSLEGDVATAGATTATFTQSTLNGNVNVSDTGSANLRFDQSRITGDVVAASGGTASVTLNNSSQLTGRLENVQQVSINSSSNWTLNADNTVANLAMNGGQVTFGDNATFYRLNVENLSGNGTFVMASDFSNGNTDFLNVTGNASGSHGLLMGSNGADPSLDSLKVVHMGSGDAQFSLLNQGEQVDLGAYSYKLVQRTARIGTWTGKPAPSAR
ncbi:hypothetical protein NWF32_12895 [Pseudomonas qingdaonensis]|nr:hypothetical protein [Pseudomonas qingdaonensis]